jgi:hypothetical protein
MAHDNPLVDAPRKVGEETLGRIPKALLFSADPNAVLAASGMSGSPVFDEALGGIIGVVVARKKAFYATELSHVVENWPEGRKYFKSFNPKHRFVTVQTAIWVLSAATIALGLTAWSTGVFRSPRHSPPPVPKNLEVELIRESTGHAEKVPGEITAAEGEKLKFLITSPENGYLYVLDREVGLDGTLGKPFLAFPTLSTGAGHNQVTSGAIVRFPDPSDRSPTIEPKPRRPHDPNYAGESLTVLVYDNPLPIDHLEAKPIPYTPEDLQEDGERLLFPSSPEPRVKKMIKLMIRRASRTTQPE